MIRVSEAIRGAVYRRTRNPTAGVYYMLAATASRDTIEKARAHHVKRLEKKGTAIMGREAWVLNRLSEGWVPLYRYTRRYKADGTRVEDKDITAGPPDMRLREVASKPGYRKRSQRS